MANFIDIQELLELPGEFAATLHPKNLLPSSYRWWDLRGDSSAFFALFMDNLATQLSLAGMAIGAVGLPAQFVWEKFFGGVGLSIFVGNLYYSMQAAKVAHRSGKMNTCAQPYGINTPGAIAKTFGILGPVFWATGDHEKAWETACIANFFGGVFEFLGAFIAPALARNVPQAAIMVPIGGIGLTWLGINPLLTILSSHFAKNPMVGFIPFVILWVAYFGTPQKGLFGPVIPAAAVACVVGVILNLFAQTADWESYSQVLEDSTDFLQWNGMGIPGWGQTTTAFQEYGALVLGLAFTNFIGTYACNISARKGGDLFPVMESMMVDGLGSMLGAVFGSPYGTTVYIGHVAYKKMGATRGYSLLNGALWLIFGVFGFHAFLQALIPNEVVSGILIVVGFSMAAQVCTSAPSRWFPAVLLGMAIGFSDLIIGGMGASNPDIVLLGNGYVWISLLYSWFLMMLIDRWFLAAALAFAVCAGATFIGLIHGNEMNVKYTDAGTLRGSEGLSYDGMPGWKFIVMYMLAGILCLLLHAVQRAGYVEPAEEEDFRQLQDQEFNDLGHLAEVEATSQVQLKIIGVVPGSTGPEGKVSPVKPKTVAVAPCSPEEELFA
ncbi:xanthine/uracil permease [Amphidinium carterae]